METQKTVTETETEAELKPMLPAIDMGGYKFSMLTDTPSWCIHLFDTENMNGDLVNDTVYVRNRNIEAKYNVTVAEIESGNALDTCKTAIASGDNEYSMIMIYDWSVAALIKDDYIIDINSIPYINIDNPWWDLNNSSFTIEGRQYCTSSDFNLGLYDQTRIIMINNDIYKTIDTGVDLYQTVIDGKWTMDTMKNISIKFAMDLDGNGEFDSNDRYGICGHTKGYYSAMTTGAGVYYVEKDKNDKPYFALEGNQKAFNIFEKIMLISREEGYFYNSDLNDVREGTLFHNNGALLFATAVSQIPTFRDMENDYGILPAPKYDENQDRYYSQSAGAGISVYPITLTGDELDYTGIISEDMAYMSYIDLIPAYYEIVLKTKLTRDNESVAILDIVFANRMYDIGMSFWTSIHNDYLNNIFKPLSDTFVSFTEKNIAKYQALLDEVNKN